ncbi:hypothetical protein [Mesorhizobium sp. M2A.F.Ca.ET.042.01.1.1]|uniref:hypothetical protein n=1 Tax=Mesorhizobium sp. M2A.F.Ca.ET.042.01.1.1 TaxID=2496745 RepID=UPI00167A6147|nr:hypothetical protein [Mesorhizobium sp. M2A.F.Ca.ET.042.01.1.1]
MGNRCNRRASLLGRQLPGPNENAASASRAASNSADRCWIVSGNKAETSSGHGAGLAGHGLGEALTLQSGRQVHFAAGEKAGKELHHHLHLVAQTGRLRLMEWGSSFFAGADIGSLRQKLNRKNEALDMKSDTICDIFGQCAHNFLLFTVPYLTC